MLVSRIYYIHNLSCVVYLQNSYSYRNFFNSTMGSQRGWGWVGDMWNRMVETCLKTLEQVKNLRKSTMPNHAENGRLSKWPTHHNKKEACFALFAVQTSRVWNIIKKVGTHEFMKNKCERRQQRYREINRIDVENKPPNIWQVNNLQGHSQ